MNHSLLAKHAYRSARENPWKASGILTVLVAVFTLAAASLYAADRGPQASSNSESATVTPLVLDYMPVTVFGDSYAAGVGAESGRSFSTILGSLLCWKLSINAQPGTGYVSSGNRSDYETFPDRVRSALRFEPEILVIASGPDDVGQTGVQTAAEATYREIRRLAPRTAIVVVGPTKPPGLTAEQVLPVRDAILTAAREMQIAFVDPIAEGWLQEPGVYADDLIHPNTAGSLAYAQNLRSAMERIGLPRLRTCERVPEGS